MFDTRQYLIEEGYDSHTDFCEKNRLPEYDIIGGSLNPEEFVILKQEMKQLEDAMTQIGSRRLFIVAERYGFTGDELKVKGCKNAIRDLDIPVVSYEDIAERMNNIIPKHGIVQSHDVAIKKLKLFTRGLSPETLGLIGRSSISIERTNLWERVYNKAMYKILLHTLRDEWSDVERKYQNMEITQEKCNKMKDGILDEVKFINKWLNQ